MSAHTTPRRPVPPAVFLALLAVLALGAVAPVPAQQTAAPQAIDRPEIPDIPVVTQDGREVQFYSDLVRGRTVAVNFIFTTCTTICPPLGLNFGRLRQQLGERAGRDVFLLSVSVDPGNDTPERLRAWSEKFGAGPGWTLVTGKPAEITRLLKALGAFTADARTHTPLILLGNDTAGRWTRTYGLAPPAELARQLDDLATPAQAVSRRVPAEAPAPAGARGTIRKAALRTAAGTDDGPAARRYFTDVVLIDQDGREQRLYSDLLQGKIVLVHSMFTQCNGVCPVMTATVARIQERLGDRLGRDVHLLSLSVDPANDTPARLKEYAGRFNARPGWYFLTGSKENLDLALHKLGLHVEKREEHLTLMMLGNDRTGLWKKALGLAQVDEVWKVFETVLNDQGEEKGAGAPAGAGSPAGAEPRSR
jgi:protein SCO1/2